MCVPRYRRDGEPESGRQRVGDLKTVGSKGGKCAGGPAELEDRCGLEHRVQPTAGAMESVGPAGGFEPERDRGCLLEPRPTGHGGISVSMGLFSSGSGGPMQVMHHSGDRAAKLKHECGVENVLAGRAPMDIASRVWIASRDGGGEMANQGNHDVPVVSCLSSDLGYVIQFRARSRLDRTGGLSRDEPDRRFRGG